MREGSWRMVLIGNEEVAEEAARPLEESSCHDSDRRRRAVADDTACAPCSSLARWPATQVPAPLLGNRDRPSAGLGSLAQPPARRGAAGPARAPAARAARGAQPGGRPAPWPERVVGLQVAA